MPADSPGTWVCSCIYIARPLQGTHCREHLLPATPKHPRHPFSELTSHQWWWHCLCWENLPGHLDGRIQNLGHHWGWHSGHIQPCRRGFSPIYRRLALRWLSSTMPGTPGHRLFSKLQGSPASKGQKRLFCPDASGIPQDTSLLNGVLALAIWQAGRKWQHKGPCPP